MRYLLVALLVAAAVPSRAEEPTSPPPQAIKALEHLNPRTHSGPISWTAGPYQYDGSGNIAAIGSESFRYDALSRLRSATVRGPDLTTFQTQTFGYDEYGNLTSTSKLGQTIHLPVTASTNQLSNVTYDASGNVAVSGDLRYGYDALGMLNTIHVGAGAQPRMVYAYTADDERLLAFDVSTGTTHWTLRGVDNKVLRDVRQNGAAWSVERDYVYRDGQLLAALKGDGSVEHYSLDHLGTPRLITNARGDKVGYHVYWPYGEEWSPGNAQEGAPLKFTGHERDPDLSGEAAPLDYMHARYYRPAWGRFLSVDPGDDSRPATPQTWNGYAYAHDNPLGKVDSDGEAAVSYWVKLIAKDIWRRVSRDAAVRVSEAGAEHAVEVIGPGASREARAIFKEAHPGVKVIRHEAHPGPAHGSNARKPHYQAKKSGIGGQVGYDIGMLIAGFLPVVGWIADADETSADASPHVNRRAQEMYGVDFYDLPALQRAAVIASLKPPRQAQNEEKEIDPATGKTCDFCPPPDRPRE